MRPDIFTEIVWEFFIYAFIGWVWETSLAAFKQHKFVDTGFLIGPITPIYGFAVLGVIHLLRPWQNQLGWLFIMATILVSLLEYFTGFLLEKLFHTKWWNYSHVPGNIQGRIALPVSIFWGICCVLIIRYVQPQVLRLVGRLEQYGFLLPVILIALGAFDFGFTLANLQSFRQKLEHLNTVIEERKAQYAKRKAQLGSDLDDIKAGVQENWEDFLQKQPQVQDRLTNLNFGQRHFLRSFPNLKIDNANVTKQLDEIKELVAALVKRGKEHQRNRQK